MKNKSLQLKRVAALVLAICLCLSLAACFGQKNPEATDAPAAQISYTVSVQAEGGQPLAGVGVFIYTDATKAELVWFDKTNDAGTMTFTESSESSGWVVILSDVPEGYLVEENYPLTGEATQITLKPTLLEEGDLSQITYKLGDIVHDFTVTTPDGTEYSLGRMMKEKQVVVLNFWYNTCQPCKAEFPYLEEAYRKYSDVVALVGMNPVDQDDAAIADFQKQMETTFPMAKCDPNWENAMQISGYPTTVVIDRFGTICLIHTGPFEDVRTVESLFAYFTAVDYKPTVMKSLDELPLIEEEEDTEGTVDNPVEIGGVTSFDVTIKPGKTKYYNLYKVDKMYLQYWSDVVSATYEGYSYDPSYGTVGFGLSVEDTYTPAKVSFTNESKKEVSFTVYLTPFAGTVNNPYPVELGEFHTTVYAGNEQGVYHLYTAPEDGVFTVICKSATSGVNFDYTLYNLDSYAFRTMSEDGTKDADGNPKVSVKVSAGDDVQIIIGTLPDSTNTYPGGNFISEAIMGEPAEEEEEEKIPEIYYAVTVTDENRNPMEGVYLNVNTADSVVVLKTDAKGIATAKLPEGTYSVKLMLPEGYKSNTTDYLLTKAVPMASVMIEKIVIVMCDYTVTVLDDAGKPVVGTVVAVGDQFAFTDSKGQVSFNLLEGDYTAMVSAPAGYQAESSYAFPAGKTELTIQLQKAAAEEPKPTEPEETQPGGETKPSEPGETTPTEPTVPAEMTYTVTVTDYEGNAQTGIVAQFLKDGTQVGMQPLSAEGKASMKLTTGTYTVKLAFAGTALPYEQSTAVVSADAPDLHIKIATGEKGAMEELYVGNAYYMNVGGTYVTMQADTVNYYLFTPTVSGNYQFSTSNKDARISFWGGSTAFIAEMTSSTDYTEESNSFTRNVKEGNLGGTFIIGITGADSCILEITRLGDAILDESDMVPEVYNAKTPPTSYSHSASGTLTYVDLTSSAKAVYNETDGKYHLNDANGPELYVNLGKDAPYISMWNMLGFTGYGGTSLQKVFRDENGVALRKEDYTACMISYVECADSRTGLYPLTEDLIYMIQNGGEYKGWWDSSNGNYVFTDVTNLNTETAWMFACCYYG